MVISFVVRASFILKIAAGTSSGKSKISLPALKAAKSISPGFLKLLAPFMFRASVKIKPLKFNSFFNKSVTIISEIDEGYPGLLSKLGTSK